jgi:hypothetical protein
MAPLPVASTARLFVDYISRVSSGSTHTLQVRYSGADRTAAAAQATVAAFLNAVGATWFYQGWRVLAVRTALAGEEFTASQVVIPALSTFVGTSTAGINPVDNANQWVWCARGLASPRRLRISLFGIVSVAMSPNGRWTPAAAGFGLQVANSLSALRSGTANLVCIDGTTPVWYSYVNTGRNDYWERKFRTS